MEAGGRSELDFIEKLQNKIQFDDPVNIQFTSVSAHVAYCEFKRAHSQKSDFFSEIVFQNVSYKMLLDCSIHIVELIFV